MYLEDEINVVGIIEEKELVDSTTKAELEKILIDALSIGPMLDPLLKDMESKGMISPTTGEINQQDVVKSLYSNSYLTECPRVSLLFYVFPLKCFVLVCVFKRNYCQY